MKKVCIFYNEDKEKAVSIYKDCLRFFQEKNIKIIEKKDVHSSDFCVVIGGDGTLLRNFKYIFSESKYIPPTVAINAGSMGYLTEVTEKTYLNIFNEILNDDFSYEERYILKIKFNNKTYFSLNEVVLTRENIQTNVVNTFIEVNNKKLAKYKGDGVIISTPTGSTAYSLSVGGPIIMPNLKLILVSPIAPHNLNTRPIILDGEDKINIRVIEPSKKAFLNIDGQSIDLVDIKDTIKINYSDKKIKLVIPKNRNYYDVLYTKLKWGDSLC